MTGVRTRGGLGGTGGHRGASGRGGRGGASGRGSMRPAAANPISSCMVEDLQEVLPLERALRNRAAKVLPSPSSKLSKSNEPQPSSSANSIEVQPSYSNVAVCSNPPSPALVRTRGGRGGASGRAGAAGRGSMRPAAANPISSCMVEDLQEVLPLERALRNRAAKVLPSPSNKRSKSNELRPSSSADSIEVQPSCSSVAVCSNPPSPALHVECGSGVSTPRSELAVNLTPRSSGAKRPRHGAPGESTPKRCRRSLDPYSSSSSRPLRDDTIADVVFYGSEEDSDDTDEEGMAPPVLVPRMVRIYWDDEDREEVVSSNAEINLAWPLHALLEQPSHGPLAAAAVASASPPADAASPPADAASPPADAASPPADTANPVFGPNKFCFDWKAFPTSQISPDLRREPFSSNNVGPTASFSSPYEAFTAIWDREIMEYISLQTNTYAQQLAEKMFADGTIRPRSRITQWLDTDANELYVYFAVLLATGITAKSRIEEYWSKSKNIFSTPGFSCIMSFDRFQLLSKCIHFNDNATFNVESRSRSQAKLFKIQPIIEHLNTRFQTLYNLSQNVALDDSLTMWKGWLGINQFIQNKAATVGIKAYEVCESQTGYLWRFEVHAGHETSSANDSPISGHVPALVLRLLNGLEHKGHTIWMDKFYNSPALARELKLRGFDCVGTLRKDRQFVPLELANLGKNELAVGEVRGCTSGDVDLVVWREKKQVSLISTYHGLATAKCGGVLKPSIIPDYNVCMGCVDRKDQMLAMYPMESRRTRVWYKKFFRRLLNVSVLNAYILHKSEHAKLTHRQFRKKLTIELLAKHATYPIKPPKVAPPPNVVPITMHFPGQYDFTGQKTHERMRRVCAVCKKRTTSYCKACNIPLCVFTCFEPHHTKLHRNT